MSIAPENILTILAASLGQRDLFIVVSILLLCLFAISRVAFPKLFLETVALDKLFGFRVKEDLGSNIRPFSTEHIFFTGLFAINLAFVALFLVNYQFNDLDQTALLKVNNVGQGLLLWLILGVAINLIVYLKYLFIRVLGFLFAMKAEVNRHFTDYINASSLFYLLVSVAVALSTYATFKTSLWLLQVLSAIILIFLFYRTLLLYIKLLQVSPYSKLYIFSYICSTELIPLLIGLKFLV